MVSKVLRYKIKASEIEEVLSAIKEFLMAMANSEPDTRYEVMQLVDNVNFIHTMHFPSQMAEEQHQKAQYTQKFMNILYASCEVEPEFVDVKEYFSTK